MDTEYYTLLIEWDRKGSRHVFRRRYFYLLDLDDLLAYIKRFSEIYSPKYHGIFYMGINNRRIKNEKI